MIKGLKIIKKTRIEKLPSESGVYVFFENKKIIYIGKAKNIKERVKAHFKKTNYKDVWLVERVDKIGYLPTKSEIEALILESKLIKKHQPRYNIMWRDDKNYFWVEVKENKNKIPYLLITHQKSPSKISLGPFTEGSSLKNALRVLRKIFPYYTTKNHPKVKCLYCHLELCPGPNPDIKKYKKDFKKLIDVLRGKKNKVLLKLKKEMMDLVKEEKFEQAAKIRDKISSLEYVLEHAQIIKFQTLESNVEKQDIMKFLGNILASEKIPQRIECYDVSNIQGKLATGSMIVFINGKPEKNYYRHFKIKTISKPNDLEMLKEVLKRRFAHKEWPYPDIILLDGGRAQLNKALELKVENPELSKIKFISLAKPKKELWIENRKKSIALKKLPNDLANLLLNLDKEAHRFAINYHKKLRKMNLFK